MSRGTDADQKLEPAAARGPRRWTMALTVVVAIGSVLGLVLHPAHRLRPTTTLDP